MAGARKKPAKKKMVRGPKQATMRQAPEGTSEEYGRRSKALAKRHGWTKEERLRWERLQRATDRRARHLSEHAKATKRGKAHGKAADAAEKDYLRRRKAGERNMDSYRAHEHHRWEEDSELRRGARTRQTWRGTGIFTSDHPDDPVATGKKINPTERVRRAALARQEKEGKAKRAAAKKKVTTAKKAAKKAAPKRSPAKKRASPLKGRSYR